MHVDAEVEPIGPETTSEWRATIDDLRVQIEVARGEAAQIDAGRGETALRAQLGDEDARALLGAQSAEIEALSRQAEDLERALGAARVELVGAEKREAAARRAKDLAEAEKLTREALVLSEKLDAAIAQSAADAIDLERLLVRAAALRGASNALIGERVVRAVRAAYWNAGLKVGEYVRPAWRAPLVEGLGAALGPAAQERVA